MVGYPCIPHPFAALQVYCYTFSLDLHVLGAPPAFVLSQDQTLIKVLLELDPRATSSIHLTLLVSRSIQLSKNRSRSSREPRTLLRGIDLVKRQWKIFFRSGVPENPSRDYEPHRPQGWIKHVRLTIPIQHRSQALHSSFYYRRVFTMQIGFHSNAELLKLTGIAAARGHDRRLRRRRDRIRPHVRHAAAGDQLFHTQLEILCRELF